MNINFRPIGRLGNAMFQAAATLGYARKHGANWGVQSNLREVPNLLNFFPKIPVLNGEFKRFNRTDPSQFNYEEFPKFEQDTTLLGFFQSKKYFEHCEDEVKELFKLDIKPVDAVSIHVRRGDYVTYSDSFPPITPEYIDRAIRGIECKAGKISKVIYFSDDIEYCKKTFATDWTNVDFSEGRNEFEDLSLMASCSHHIIANSTFSWMCAYLGHNPNKIIVSPDPSCWFGPGFTGGVPIDLLPAEWIKIKFR